MASEREANRSSGAEPKAVKPGFGLSPREASEYIAELVDELADLARSADLRVLAYLLDVGALEAKTKAHELTDAPRPASC